MPILRKTIHLETPGLGDAFCMLASGDSPVTTPVGIIAGDERKVVRVLAVPRWVTNVSQLTNRGAIAKVVRVFVVDSCVNADITGRPALVGKT
ncbi:MAG TPA: hypothetical protein G4O12_02475 [Dehalococcoidia bacterium]|nr:hypothetical protein [Dehalococcoidia bacterium]